MTTITVYDPPMCCSTGVCGPTIDPKLTQFASDLEWLKTQGVFIQRDNLSQEPEQFIENSDVKAILERSGDAELPAIVVAGKVVSSGCFPSRDELIKMADIKPSNPENTPDQRASGDENGSTAETAVGSCGCAPNTAGCS